MRSLISLIVMLMSTAGFARPCEVMVLANPAGVDVERSAVSLTRGQRFVDRVIAGGGRILSLARLDLPLTDSGTFISANPDQQVVTVVTTIPPTAPRDPLDRVNPDHLYSTPQVRSADGIGKVFMGREIAQVMGHLGAGWLDRPEREQEERTDTLIELMDLEPDDVIADIGSGSGYFTLLLAPRVPEGKVIGVDIQPQMNRMLERKAKESGLSNIETILGRIDDVRIPENSVDVILMVDAYHEFSHPWEMSRSMMKALKPGGRIVLVEFRAEDPDVLIKLCHKMHEPQARRELEAAGFIWKGTRDELPQQHVLLFEKPRRSPDRDPETR